MLSLILHSSGTFKPSVSGLERSAVRWETAQHIVGEHTGSFVQTQSNICCVLKSDREHESLSENVSGRAFVVHIECQTASEKTVISPYKFIASKIGDECIYCA